MLLFLALLRLTGAVWESACVAALFALHPLHVESVAWAASRKDVLSGVFFMRSLLAWARYRAAPIGVPLPGGRVRVLPADCSRSRRW